MKRPNGFGLLSPLALAGALLCACGADPVELAKGAQGDYEITVTAFGKSDPDRMTVAQGKDGTVLLTFLAGIETPIDGPNPSGLRGSLDGDTLSVARQPIRVDHSTGVIEGSAVGTGTLSPLGGTAFTLRVIPTNYAVDPGEGSPTAEGEVAIPYEITGSRR